ncbi:MAG TPA: 4-alpha-glucanotransferase, partial [Terriglobales bacterium]|nr:4-alpha-glucanotransferase [Terriglobales bacterium]
RERGIVDSRLLASPPAGCQDCVDFAAVIDFKMGVLRRAAQTFLGEAAAAERAQFDAFCQENHAWLDDYALFMACKETQPGPVWSNWDPALRRRDAAALRQVRTQRADEIAAFKYWQYEFFRQWAALRSYCGQRGIRIMGDIPIYVAHDSADVWANPELFHLDDNGRPTVVAGVPPDYFSATGQLWGNPIYRWERVAASGYSWWIARFRAALRWFDIVRLDHFRGFEAYWEIPGNEAIAVHGRWVKGPGAELFRTLQSELGDLPIVAENLGVITPEVEAIRHEFGFPGMSLLQFAFGKDPQGPSFRPHNYVRELVAYTGGHDNDTTVGWWNSSGQGDSTRTAEDIRRERAFTRAYLGFENEPINWVFIRAVLASVADVAIIPLQDVLGLGSEARMNLPGTVGNNWKWRYRAGSLTSVLRDRLRELTAMYDR